MKYCLYMMVTDTSEGSSDSFCKIGITGDLAKRVAQVQTGCPMKIKDVAYMETGYSRRAESIFHQEMAAYHTHGEWFRLDFQDPEAKAAFGRAMKRVHEFVSPIAAWKHMDIDAVRMLCKVLRLDKVA